MNLKQLEALIYVSRHGTFKQAAEALYFDSSGEDYITPESIQYRIKQLEQELGVSLYRKRQGSSRVTLTREGQLFLGEAIEVYQRMNEWRGMFLEAKKGALTFAATQAVLIHRLPDAVCAFRKKHPQMGVRLINAHAQQAEQMVAEGRVDFSLSTRPPEQSELDYFLWKRSNMVAVVPEGHVLAAQKQVSLAQVAEYPLVMLEPEIRGDRELMDEAFRKVGIRSYNLALEASNSEIIATFVEAGLGVTVVAETSMARQSRKLVAVPISDPVGQTEVGLLVREGQYIPFRVREFLTMLDTKFAEWLAERDHENVKKIEQQAGTNGPSAATSKKARSAKK